MYHNRMLLEQQLVSKFRANQHKWIAVDLTNETKKAVLYFKHATYAYINQLQSIKHVKSRNKLVKLIN